MTTSSRNCTRCGQELTDAASMEVGIGPVCRKLDNALLARLIPSNVTAAKAAFDNIDLTAVAPETLDTLNEVYTVMFSEESLAKQDWRLEVKRIEWALSYPANNFARADLTKVVALLGYVGLASLWNGEAATGEATCLFLNGRLVVKGPRNKSARIAFRKIVGTRFHPVGTLLASDAAWSFPASAHEAFFTAIITHYPNSQGLMETVETGKKAAALMALEAAQATKQVVAAAANPTPVTPKAAPKCSIAAAGLFLKVRTPYKPEFIDSLKKAFPYNDRRWNGTEKCWEVVASHKAKVEALTKQHFGDAEVVCS